MCVCVCVYNIYFLNLLYIFYLICIVIVHVHIAMFFIWLITYTNGTAINDRTTPNVIRAQNVHVWAVAVDG